MGQVRTRTLCCCIPVRVGAFVIALLGLFGGALGTVGVILQAKSGKNVNKAVMVIQIMIYVHLIFVSLFGLVAVIMKRRKFIVLYWVMLVVHVAFSVFAGVISLYALFKTASADISRCVSGSPPTDLKACQKAMTITKVVSVAVCIVVWLVEIYACIVVDCYAKQLADEEDQTYKADTESGTVRW